MASISADCPHPAPVSLHCPVRIMVLVLSCAELHVLHCPMICLFCPGSAFDGSAIEFVPACSVFFMLCHAFSSLFYLYMPCSKLLAQEAAVHQRKKLLTRFSAVI